MPALARGMCLMQCSSSIRRLALQPCTSVHSAHSRMPAQAGSPQLVQWITTQSAQRTSSMPSLKASR
jgi:hypothetical protein